jgi:D-xylose transport system substrate-binding protein
MKRFIKVFALSMSIAIMSTALTGCGIEKSDPKNSSEPSSSISGSEKIKVGLSMPTLREERWTKDKEKMESEAKRLNIDLETQVSDNDLSKQISQCENLLSKGIKVLIVAPQDATAAATIVEKAHQSGVKVISYDRLILKSDVDLYVSFDNKKVGELQAKYLVNKTPKGNYAILSGDPADNNAKLFKEGAMSVIDPLVKKGDIKIVIEQACKDWKAEEAMKHMENALTASKNKIDAVLAPNDGTAGGCIQALAAQGLAGKVPISGQDSEGSAVKRIKEGTQTMTIFKDTRKLGEVAMAAALKYAKGEKPETNATSDNQKISVPSVLLEPVVVDKENYQKTLIDSGYLKESEIK